MLLFNVKYSFNRTAVITDDSKTFSYHDINDFSDCIFEVIKNRCLVFCLCQNTIGSLAGYISFIANKIVPVLLDSKLDGDLLTELINIYKPQYIWLPNTRVNEFFQGQIIFSKYNYSLLKFEQKKFFSLHPNLALLLTTSGSTGSSKFVRISYDNIEANALSIAKYLSIDKTERPITTLPMNYSFGLSIINSHILKEATILLTSKTLMEKDFWQFFMDQKASSMSGVPYTFEILKKLKFMQMDLPSLKTITQAGGRLNYDLNKEFSSYCNKTDKRFFVMYGQTEATARMSYLPPEYALTKTGSIGIAIPGGSFSLIDENLENISEAGFVGELVYRGKNVSMGYANCGDDLIKEDENQGILFTGDLAKRDSENFYYIVSRKGRFIKIFGNRISLDEIENLLQSIVSECACTGKDDHMIIYITDKTRLTEVKNYIARKIGINHLAFSVRYCSEIPRNYVGKNSYSKLDIS